MLGLRIARGKTMGIRNHGESAGAENNAMRRPGENQLAARFTETGSPRGQKNQRLGISKPLT
jgi:hypothetical protein